jgi:hypothetical protein
VRPSSEIKRELEWLARNLGLQVEDRSFRGEQIAVEIYFDTVDVRRMIQGVEAYSGEVGELDVRGFEDERVLIEALATGGWLGGVSMLPAHQAELLLWLNRRIREGESGDVAPRAEEFLSLVGVTVTQDLRGEGRLVEDDEEWREVVRRQAGTAERFFKALQTIRGNWRHRLRQLKELNLLRFESYDYDYGEFVEMESFRRLMTVLGEKRQGKDLNNFTDAVAIMSLADHVRRYREGRSRVVPRFYDAHGFFADVCNAAGLNDMLTYTATDGGRSSVLTEAPYFRLRAAYSPGVAVPRGGAGDGASRTTTAALKRLRDEVGLLLASQEPLTPELIEEVSADGGLQDVIRELRQFAFLERIWLPTLARADLVAAWDALRESQEESARPGFHEAVKRAIEEVRSELGRNAREFREVANLWVDLQGVTERLRTGFAGVESASIDLLCEVGLQRFGFPRSVNSSLRTLLGDMAFGAEDQQRASRGSAIQAWRGKVRQRGGVEHGLGVVCGALWVGEKWQQIVDLLDHSGNLGHWSLRAIRAAALLKYAWRRRGDIERDIAAIERHHDEMRGPRRRAEVAMALGYLYFHMWLASGGRPWWRGEGIGKRGSEEKRSWVLKAVGYADEAAKGLEAGSANAVYAANQYLYYLVEGAEANKQEEIVAAAARLAPFKQRRGRAVWQYRYDDTLARYFHRRAAEATTREGWAEGMKSARAHIESARRAGRGDDEVEAYWTELQVYESAGFDESRVRVGKSGLRGGGRPMWS